MLESTRDDVGCEPWDQVLIQTPNFVVLPTIGAIVEGWVLLVPKKHYLCIGALKNELLLELEELKSLVSEILQDCYGAITVFEHGPASTGHPVGCGIDHAHLHMVPTKCDLIKGVREVFPHSLQWIEARGIKDTVTYYEKGLSYLYIEQPIGKAYLASHLSLVSQLFRRVIAVSVGHPERYDWNIFKEQHIVELTVNKLRAQIAGMTTKVK
jgi:diadenosine tetraphosphate (Ap4A) HIT family hydrolase